MRALKTERFWITIVKYGMADNTYGIYEYLPDQVTRLRIDAPPALGDYEVRLHANYPTKTTNVVFRVPITVAR